jgi:lipid-A-disaccharide synthase
MTLLPLQRAALSDNVRIILPKLACVAGEPSGDLLAAPVLSALNQIPDMSGIEVYGIGGPRMQAEGMRSDWPMETLSVRGYVEAIKQLPAILKLRKELIAHLLGEGRPDVYLGIDAPDFNLGVELQLRKAGIPTLHFVSPSIWAWNRCTWIYHCTRVNSRRIKRCACLSKVLGHFGECGVRVFRNKVNALSRMSTGIGL